MAVKKYKGIVIGAGAIGALLEAEPNRPKPATHAGALSTSLRSELVAIVDTNKDALKKAAKLFPKARTYTSLQNALTEIKPDIACIATGASTHLALIKTLGEAGVPMIVCEKPLAVSVQEAKAIEKIVRKHKTTFVLNYQRRFFNTFNEAQKGIRKGTIGKVQAVTCYYSNGLYSNGGHTVDALQYLLSDSIKSARGHSGQGVHPKGDLQALAHLTFTKGTKATLVPLDQSFYGIHDFHIYGTKGAYHLTDYGYTLTQVPAGPSLFTRHLQ